jgi:membrane protease YdiL (CAAX protease family)
LSIHRRLWAAAGIAGTVALPFVHLELPVSGLIVEIAVKWLWTIALAAIVFRIERRPREFLQWRGFSFKGALEAFVSLLAALVLAAMLRQLIHEPPEGVGEAEPAALAMRLAGAITAGICEEFMYRGFLIEEAGEWMRSRKLAGVFATVVFAAAHWDRGWVAAMIGPGLIGTALTVTYFRQRSLPLCMVMHSLIDVCYELVQPGNNP